MSEQLFKASLAEVEEQIKETQVDYGYRLTEFSIGELIKKFRTKSYQLQNEDVTEQDLSMSFLLVPSYQRDFQWHEKMQSEFIESIFMGVPIQPLFAFELDEEGNLELLDGVQRLSSIKSFVSNTLQLNELTELDTLNKYFFSELEVSRRRKFLNTSLRVYILNEKTDEGVRADIFRRINDTGLKLEAAEIRKGKFINNKFYDFILESIRQKNFSDLFSATKQRSEKLKGEKEELLTRFFAYSDQYENFVHSVKGFLDDYIVSKGLVFTEAEKIEKEQQLNKTLEFVTKYFSYGFRKSKGSKSIPRVRFEAISVGVNLALKEKPDLKDPDLKWLESKEFREHTTSDAANNKSKLVGRIEFVRDCLLSKINVNDLNYDI